MIGSNYMEKEEALRSKYSTVPESIRSVKRWVCYRIEIRDGKSTKVPLNAISGNFAKVDDPSTWTDFSTAIVGCCKYECAGLGLVLGNGIFGVDLDNHGEMPQEDFDSLAEEFINALDSYTEYSQSGKGIHIICYGTLPNVTSADGQEIKGRRRKGNIEMYDNGRFFAFTGNAIRNKAIEERTNEVIPLWKKYVDDTEERKARIAEAEARASSYPLIEGIPGEKMDDAEVIDRASKSESGAIFVGLYGGDLSNAGGDHSKADLQLCNYLAFWTNCDEEQMDRIFRSSGLMRDKWTSMRGGETYGHMTIAKACESLPNGGYVKVSHDDISLGTPHSPIVEEKGDDTPQTKIAEMKKDAESPVNYMNVGADGEPIFRLNYNIRDDYKYNDTGNAERFYDYFGDCFKYNVDAKMFMFWTGKSWIFDEKDIIRKYADKLLDIMNSDLKAKEKEVRDLKDSDDGAGEAKKLQEICLAARKNVERLSNNAGKNAMFAELQHIHDIPVKNNEFDTNPYVLNTESGIVNLKTGMISVFDKMAMLSKNTHTEISYDEPKEWLVFLHGIFYRGDDEKSKKETEEIIACMQQCLGLSLTGSTREQVMFMMYGSGSNGKSTFIEEMSFMMGDYYKTIDSSMLMSQAASNASIQFSLAELVGCRFLVTKETNEGEKLAEGTVKAMTGTDQINAQQKYGRPFQFMPQFKLWMMTNNLPIIRGADFGIWRRIFLIPFMRRFTDSEKDMDMPEKLRAETPKILGWCVKGFQAYIAQGRRLVMPNCLKEALHNYQDDMDVVAKFLNKCCKLAPGQTESCASVFSAFKNWAVDNREFILRESKFSDSMVTKGHLISTNINGEQCYSGIVLLPSYRQQDKQYQAGGYFNPYGSED